MNLLHYWTVPFFDHYMLQRDQDDQYIKTESPSKSRGPKRRVVEAFDLTGDDEVMVSMEPPTKKARPSDGQEAISLDD